MDAPLQDCSIEEQSGVVRFLWAGVKPVEIHHRMLAQYGQSTMSQQKVYEWVERFKSGRTRVTDEGHSGQPSTSRTQDHIDRADAMIREDRRITVSKVTAHLDNSIGSAYAILHDDLRYRKVCARWVPKELTVVHKRQRVEVANQFVRRYEEDPSILVRILTADKTWVHHYDPDSKRQSMEWKHPSSPAKKKFKRQPSAKKIMLTPFWDMHGPILVHFQAHGQTVNSANYCAMLQNELKTAIRKKRRGMLSKKVLLHHDKARHHTAAATVETEQQLGFELQHAPYSPDLAPSDDHIFGPLKEALRGRRFASDEEVKEAVHTWLREQPKSFFSAGIQKLVERYNKCIVSQGDYVEK